MESVWKYSIPSRSADTLKSIPATPTRSRCPFFSTKHGVPRLSTSWSGEEAKGRCRYERCGGEVWREGVEGGREVWREVGEVWREVHVQCRLTTCT